MGNKRTVHAFMAMALVIAASLGATPVRAIGPCGPFNPMDAPSANCRPAFTNGQYLRIVDGISFVWLRTSPSSQAAVVATAWPRQGSFSVSGAPGNPFFFDGYQWWWYVQMYPGGWRGWVEQYSLTPETPSTLYMGEATHQPPPTWGAPADAMLRAGVPFAWLRIEPRSDSPFTTTILPGMTFRVMAEPSPVSDRYQYWWPVAVMTAQGQRTGWLEQSSIAAVG
ncbi:MAG: hypothetical protein IT323_11130 [Anaerolineae bacterium]|nr:hypothetical protein [Anaerolineae bacterium]